MIVTLSNLASIAWSISSFFHILGTNIHGHLRNVYDPQYLGQNIQFLKFLIWFTQQHHNSPIIIGGDFNMITTLDERKWGLIPLSNEDQGFKSTIANCSLVDLFPSSWFFMWNNRRVEDHQISKHLDKIESNG